MFEPLKFDYICDSINEALIALHVYNSKPPLWLAHVPLQDKVKTMFVVVYNIKHLAVSSELDVFVATDLIFLPCHVW